MVNETPIQLKAKIAQAKAAMIRGEATYADVERAADNYIAAAVAHCKNKGLKPPRISRSGLLR